MESGLSLYVKEKHFDVFSIYLRADGFYQVVINAEKEFTVKNLSEVIITEKEFGAIKLPVLVICRELATSNVELLHQLSLPGSNPYAIAEAYVLVSLNQRLLANFYLRINKPSRPTKFFENEEDALTWLLQFKSKN